MSSNGSAKDTFCVCKNANALKSTDYYFEQLVFFFFYTMDRIISDYGIDATLTIHCRKYKI